MAAAAGASAAAFRVGCCISLYRSGGSAAVGGTVGGLTGALVGMGIPEYEAKRYEGKVKGGNALISVHSENSAETDRAKTIFEAAGGQDISTSSEASVGSRA